MKRYLCFLICVLLFFGGCGTDYGSVYGTQDDPNIGKQVFDTSKEIIGIEYRTNINDLGSFEIPADHLDAMIEWLGTFTISSAAGDTWTPGGYYQEISIHYADGTSIENMDLYNVVIDGAKYNAKGGERPEFLSDILG